MKIEITLSKQDILDLLECRANGSFKYDMLCSASDRVNELLDRLDKIVEASCPTMT